MGEELCGKHSFTHSTTTIIDMASLVNGSFASPLADANLRIVTEGGWLAKAYNGMSGLNVLISFLLVLVAYDQCELLAGFQWLRSWGLLMCVGISYVCLE